MLLRVRSSPHKLGTEAELYAVALRALMRRAHSVHEMRELLERRAQNPGTVRPVLDKLKQQKYLDDARYALDFARSRALSRRQGHFRVARELRARGVPDRYIDAALESVFEETDEASLVRARLKRIAAKRGALDERKIASLYRSLLRAGFSGDIIRAELRSLVKSDVPEFSEAESSEGP